MRLTILLLMLLSMLGAGATAFADPTITINENSGTCDHVKGCTLQLPQALLFPFVPGQLVLTDPDGTISDIITFTCALDCTTGGVATMASNGADGLGFDDLADVSTLPALGSNTLFLAEPTSGPLFYAPSFPGQPGSGTVGGLAPLSYSISSDTAEDVPEPSSLVLLLTGFAGVGFARLRGKVAVRRNWLS